MPRKSRERDGEVEEQEWGYGDFDAETPVSERTFWRALQRFEVRKTPRYQKKQNLTGEIVNAGHDVQVTHVIRKKSGSNFLKLASGGYVFTRNRTDSPLFHAVTAEHLQRGEQKPGGWRHYTEDWSRRQWRRDDKGERWGWRKDDNAWPQDDKGERWGWPKDDNSSWKSWGHQESRSASSSNSKPKTYPDPSDPKYRVNWAEYRAECEAAAAGA
eukprot:s3255_g9.t1